ncbi:MAG: alpha/beta hydrolase [Erythrobacter sp.]
MRKILSVVPLLAFIGAPVAYAAPERSDFYVESEDELSIFVRRISDDKAGANLGPLLLVNGGRPGALSSWDVDVPGPSTAALFAEAGHSVYLMDVRGFGRSNFTDEMRDGAEAGPIAVRSYEVVRDIKAVLSAIRSRHGDDVAVAAMGWATGSQWLGHYASLYPKEIDNLIFYQAAYGGEPGGWPFQGIAEEDDPAQLDRARFTAFRCSTSEQVVGRLANETDNQDFLDRYVELAMEGDELSETRSPPCFRFPSGPLADTLLMVNGRSLYDAGSIESRVLILRSENDFWSRPQDVEALQNELDRAASVSFVELTGVSHYAHLIPEERRAFLNAVLNFTSRNND